MKNKATSPHLAPAAILVALSLLGFAAYYVFIDALQPQVPYMDSLRFLQYYDEYQRGVTALGATWNQGDHRGLLMQLLVYLNAAIFGLNVWYAVLLSGLVLLATVAMLGGEAWYSLADLQMAPRKKLTLYFWLCLIISIGTFSFANWELFTLDFGAAIFLKNFSFILYWIVLDRAVISRPRQWRWVLCGLVLAPVIVLVVAYGWVYPFVGASLALLALRWLSSTDGSTRRVIALLAGELVAAMLVYLMAGVLFPSERVGWGSAGPMALYNGALSAMLASASVFVGGEVLLHMGVSTILVGVLGACLIAQGISVSSLYASRAITTSRSMLPAALIAYGGLDIAAIAYARGRYEPELAMASRYYMDFFLAFLGVIWGGCLYHHGRIGRNKVRRFATGGTLAGIALVSIFFAGQLATDLAEWKKAPYRRAAFDAMRDVTLKNQIGESEAKLLQAPQTVAAQAAEIQRRYRLGPFRQAGQ